MEVMMNDIIYNLLLTSELGVSLAGVLRYRVVAGAATTPEGAEQTDAAPQQAQPVELFETPLQGSLVVPLLNGITPVPLRGFLYSTAAGPLSVLLFSTGTPQVALEFNFIATATIAGGLSWQPAPGAPVSVLYSLLGRRVALA
jgi:hypothetical protein